MSATYSVTQYARLMGITRQAVLKRIHASRLPAGTTAQKIGNVFVISVL